MKICTDEWKRCLYVYVWINVMLEVMGRWKTQEDTGRHRKTCTDKWKRNLTKMTLVFRIQEFKKHWLHLGDLYQDGWMTIVQLSRFSLTSLHHPRLSIDPSSSLTIMSGARDGLMVMDRTRAANGQHVAANDPCTLKWTHRSSRQCQSFFTRGHFSRSKRKSSSRPLRCHTPT